MRLKNSPRLLLGLLILSAIGCEEAPNENLTKSNDTILPTTIVDIKMSKKPEVVSVFIGETGEAKTDSSIRAAPKAVLKSTNIDDIRRGFGTDTYVLNDARIEGDILKLNVSYNGGCEFHEFTFLAHGSFLEGCPVQMDISLAHNANGDLCRQLLIEEYHFDLTPIKILYQETRQRESGCVILSLEDRPNEIVNIVYAFSM